MTVLAVILLLFSSQAFAEMPAKVLDSYHGDTLRVEASPWPGRTIHTLVRIRGIDAPMLPGRCPVERQLAQATRDYVRQLVGDTLMLKDVNRNADDGRMVATIILPDGRDLAAALLQRGLVHPDAGPNRRPWCGRSASPKGGEAQFG